MIVDINEIVNNEWYAEMEMKLLPRSRPFTQKEAKEMCKAIGDVFLIAHGITCVCGDKYRV